MEFSEINGKYKEIPGFKDYYITEYGDVYSTRLRGAEKEPHLHKLKPKNPGKRYKYLNITLCRDDGQYTKSIHRLVAECFVEGYFDGAVVNHIDGDNRNNSANNLEWTTTKDNILKSYITSGKSAKRNYKVWELFNPAKELLGVFYSHMELTEYIKSNNLDTSTTQLVKVGNSRGFIVNKTRGYC